MRKNRRLQRPLAILLVTLMLCLNLVLQFAIQPVQADESNLADKAVAFIENQYQSQGTQKDSSTHYPYVAYVLKSADVDVSNWVYNEQSFTTAVNDLVDADINNIDTDSNNTVAVKYLAQDLIAMQAWGDSTRASQIQNILHDRQNTEGSFLNDNGVYSAYSVIPAYELLGRAGKLSTINTDHALTYILNQQNIDNGAWPPGDYPDFMTTAQAIRALNYLSPGAAPDSAVGLAIRNGCNWLKQQQQTDGSFTIPPYDDPLIDTTEAIATQQALGLNPAAAWISNGKSVVDYLSTSAVNADGSLGSSQNLMDAAWALDSCNLLAITPTANANVRVRVEGVSSTPVNKTLSVAGSALDALKQAVGSSQVVTSEGIITSIDGESGHTAVSDDSDTAWFYYVIRNGATDSLSLISTASGYNVANGDQIIFYIGAYGHTTYAPKTYLPVVSISPQAPRAGQTVTFNISAQKYDRIEGLKNLSSDETSAIGSYTVTIGNSNYTSSNGQVSIPNVAAGTLSYVISNQNSAAGFPNVVPYRGIISVTGGGGNVPLSCTPGIAVVGMSGEMLYRPSYVTVSSSNTWGLTALGALDMTGLSYDISTTTPGFVVSIAGQANSGNQGWMYTVNNIAPLVLAKDYTVSSSDKVIWYYSKSMSQSAPTWAQLSSGTYSVSTTPAVVSSNSGSAVVDPAAGGTVGLGNEAVVKIPAGALVGSDTVNVVIKKLSSPPTAPAGFRLLGSSFEFSVGNSTAYQFNQPVTLSFTFDSKDLVSGQIPSIYYYDEKSMQWVDLGGTVSGNTISINVDHFTKYSLFAKEITVAPVIEKTFTDVPADYWASSAINNLYGRGYINGYPDGIFKPDASITRAEFATMLAKALGLNINGTTGVFTDVTTDAWYYGTVNAAASGSLVFGMGNKIFSPSTLITREQMAVMVAKALGNKTPAPNGTELDAFNDKSAVSNWAVAGMEEAVKAGIVGGMTADTLAPQASATRAQATEMIYKLLIVLG